MKFSRVKQLLDQGIRLLQIQPVSTTVYNDYSFSSWQTFQINNLLTFSPIARWPCENNAGLQSCFLNGDMKVWDVAKF